MAKIAELEKQLSQARKELETLRVRLGTEGAGPGAGRAPKNGPVGASRLDVSSTRARGWGLCARPAGRH